MIDVIIVHYHAAAMVREACAALRRDADGSGIDVRIFVSDNGSTAEERALIRGLDVTYLETGSDAGYAGGINFAFPHTTADTIVIMNEDVMVLPGCLRALHDALASGAAVAGPDFFWDRDRRFRLPCTEERSRRNELRKAAGRKGGKQLATARAAWRRHARLHWNATTPIETTALSGALMAFRRDTWDAVGPWDASYQMYFDENDWLFRVVAAGLRPMYVPAAKAVHLHNPKLMSDPDRAQWASESFLRFGNRYYGERFMRRLIRVASRPQVLPSCEPHDGAIDLPRMRPLWIELTPSPLGFPAAAMRIDDPSTTRWSLPRMTGLEFLKGQFYAQLVDDDGNELRCWTFALAPAELEVAEA